VSLPSAPAGFTATSVSPRNVLGTLLVEAPPALTAIVFGDGTVELRWAASPTESSRQVDYAILRRATGSETFTELARTTGLAYSETPGSGAYEYAVFSAVSGFTSPQSPIAQATIP
jgi:hypothetical protein